MLAIAPLWQRLRHSGRLPLLLSALLCGISFVVLEVATPGHSRSLAPLPRWSGYFLVLVLTAFARSIAGIVRLWRISLHARQDQQDSLSDAGKPLTEGAQLEDHPASDNATVKGRLLRQDAGENASLQLTLRGSQATSWSTHLPPQLHLRVDDRSVALRGVATIEAGSRERWLEYQPEVRPPAAPPPRTLIVVERTLQTGDALIVSGRLAQTSVDGTTNSALIGDHRTPLRLVSARAPIVSHPSRTAANAPLRLGRWLLMLVPLVYIAGQYQWTASHCSIATCQSQNRCRVQTRLRLAPFSCETGLPKP